jgi:hypothetical protein
MVIYVPVFDSDALLQWADFPLPDNREEWPRLVNQIRTDVVAAAEHIQLLELALIEAREPVPEWIDEVTR